MMTLISPSRKMAEVIHENYLLIPIINRFGIRMGFGDKTISTICNEESIETEFFIAILNTFNNEKYFPEHRFQSFNIKVFIDYLRKTHQYYLRVQVPIIEEAINKLIDYLGQSDYNLELIRNFFKNYRTELEAHILREESYTFPYIWNIYKLYHDSFDLDLYLKVTENYSMKRFGEEHDDIDIKLFDLKNLLIKYIPGEYEPHLINTILFELFSLEKDIRDHTRLEEKILKPMVEVIESHLKNFVN